MNATIPHSHREGISENREVARTLDRVAELLEAEEANPFRVRSYRRAADRIRGLRVPLRSIYEREGEPGLRELEAIGIRLAASIREILQTGRLGMLERLEGEVSPAIVFSQLPGIGPKLAARIQDESGLHTLEELEQAAYNGRLAAVEGIGRKKIRGLQDALAGMLSRGGRRQARRRVAAGTGKVVEPPASIVLEVDESYRKQALAGELRKIAPRRFNPRREHWLPVMETERGGWSFTALFSNTQRAHELGKTRDWVVIYYHRDRLPSGHEDPCTVVTASSGDLTGTRVVRGRESECLEHYRRGQRHA